MKKKIFPALFFILCIGSIYYFKNPLSAVYSYARTAISTKEHIIEIRDQGFYPTEIKINKGDKITFLNKTAKNTWPASDLHPTHDLYRGFDAKGPVKPQGSWSFVFEKAGFWQYHDHLKPDRTGVIIVGGVESLIDATTIQNACKNPSGIRDELCLSKIIREVVRVGDVVQAFDLVSKYYETSSRGPQSCHALTHAIGEETVELFLKSKDFSLTPKAAYCAYGFYHGFMEKLISKTGDLQLAGKFCDIVDKKLASFTADAKLQCYHGIGHGTATWHEQEIIKDEDTILQPALALCEKVSTTPEQLYRCASGAFNAIALYYMSGEYKLPLDKNNPLRLCDRQDDRYKESCYGNMNTLLAELTRGDLTKASSFIEKIVEDKFAVPAMQYLSGIIASRNISHPETLVPSCRSLQARLHLPCVRGIVQGLIEHGNPGLEYKEALKFCRSLLLTQEEKMSCFNDSVNYFMSIYRTDKTLEICKSIESPFNESCQKIVH